MTGQGKSAIDTLLAESFKELALKQPIEKITIKEITDKAGVIRPTFYNHFQDKYDLLENLEGGIAWKDPEQAVRQKERLRAMKEKKELEIGHAQQADSIEEEVPEDAQGMNMTM